MALKSTFIGLLVLSLNGFAIAAPVSENWLNTETSNHKDKKGKVVSKFTYDLKDDDFKSRSFDKPFLMTSRVSLTYFVPDMKAFDYTLTTNQIIDCKNLRYATQYTHRSSNKITSVKDKKFIIKPDIEITTNFKETESVPLQFWKSFSKDSKGYRDICSQTQSFDKNYSPTKDQVSGWKFVEFNNANIYFNKDDLNKSNLHTHFKLRNKRFNDQLAPNNKPSTAVIDEVKVDCKNKKYALLKTTYLDKDFEYKTNLNPVVVDVINHVKNANNIPASKWHKINHEGIKALNICL